MRSAIIAVTIGSLAILANAAPKKRPPPKKTTPPVKVDPPKEEPKPSPPDQGNDPLSTGNGSGSATPPPTPAPPPVAETKPAEEPKSTGPDVDSLRQEYLALRDELFKSRARANTVASQLYSTRVSIKLTYTSGRFYNPAKSSIRLDGASVFENASGAIANDDGVRFSGFVAPGKHVITFRVEASGKDDDTFTSTTEASIVVKAVAGKDLVVNAKARDSGDIAYNWKRGESGSYGLAIDVGVKTEAKK